MNAAQHAAQTAVRLASHASTQGLPLEQIVAALAIGAMTAAALVFLAKKGL